MLVKVRRFVQRVGGRGCLGSRSVWVDVVLAVTFFSLFIMVYQEQMERSLRLQYRQQHGAIDIMAADGKMVRVLAGVGGTGGAGWKDGEEKAAALRQNAPGGEVAVGVIGGKEYKNISEMADIVKDKNILQSIQKILTDIPQSFGSACDNAFYPESQQFPASLIIVFWDHQLYDLKVTLSSIQVNTADSLIEEILVVDDGSTDPKVVHEAQKYVGKIPKAKLLRNERREGEAMCRMKAAKMARGQNIVFMSTTVVVAPGWLEPINDYLFRHKSCIVLPHHDKVFDPYKYETVPRTWVGQFSWSLSVEMQRNTLPEDGNMMIGVNSPAMKGDIFAISRQFISRFGLYDEAITGSGAEHLELSVRTWLCGGTVRVVRCSHVGVLDMAGPSSVDDAFGAWRVAQLWMNDHVALVSQQSGLHHNPSAKDLEDIEVRRRQISKRGNCDRDIAWYLTNVARTRSQPSKGSKTIGYLKVHNGFCAHVYNVSRIMLGTCQPDGIKYAATGMTFEHTDIGQIKVQGRCLTSVNSFVLVVPCLDEGNENQIWQKKPDNTYRVKQDGLCLMHVTDPILKIDGLVMQTLMAQPCKKDQSEFKSFSAFFFVKEGE